MVLLAHTKEGTVRFLKYCLAALGLLVAFLCLGAAAGKLMFPSLFGVWVGPHTGFVIGVPQSRDQAVELLGSGFAPIFFLAGYLLGSFSWNRLLVLRSMRNESAGGNAVPGALV